VEYLLREFNAATPGNQMKWGRMERARGEMDWAQADQFVEFCQLHRLRIKGHALVWHTQMPSWVDDALPAWQLRAALLNRVTSLVSRYKGIVRAWDVMNEATADKTSVQNGEAVEGLYRPTIVMKKLGPRIIDDLFRAAHAADPDADLIYNEYNVLKGGAKADRMYTIVQGLLQRGVPVHTVGFQGHVLGKEIDPKTEAVRGRIKRSLKRFADLGVKVTLSEIDMRVRDWPEAVRMENQREAYRALMAEALISPYVEGLTFWGFTDKFSWIHGWFGEDDPLLFDREYGLKPAYHGCCDGVVDALRTYPCLPTCMRRASRGRFEDASSNFNCSGSVITTSTGWNNGGLCRGCSRCIAERKETWEMEDCFGNSARCTTWRAQQDEGENPC